MGTQDVRTSQCPVLGLTSASTWLVYMHVTELHVCKLYNMVINTTLTCITQMIIWLCENACIHALAVQIVNMCMCGLCDCGMYS